MGLFIKYAITICILFYSSINLVTAQYLELGLGFGGALYEGDLSPDSPFKRFQMLRPAASVFGKLHLNRSFDLGINANYCRLFGDDKISDNEGRKERNLDFTSNVYEFNATIDWNILGFEPEQMKRTLTPFVFAGGGIFHHNPSTKYAGVVYRLQPLGTEGQGLTQYPERTFYKLWQPNLLTGIGMKWALTEDLNLTVDFGVRLVFTDYLDDASATYVSAAEIEEVRGQVAGALSNRIGEGRGTSPVILPSGTQRASASSTDYYMVGLIKFSWNLYEIAPFQNNRNTLGCPRFN